MRANAPTHSGIVYRDGIIPMVQVWLVHEKGHWLNYSTRKIEHPIRTPDRLPVGSVEPETARAGLNVSGSTNEVKQCQD